MENHELPNDARCFLKEYIEVKTSNSQTISSKWTNNWADWENSPGHNNWEDWAPTPPPGGK
jgi:hypothetical protein